LISSILSISYLLKSFKTVSAFACSSSDNALGSSVAALVVPDLALALDF
jgi:hypothetical protein